MSRVTSLILAASCLMACAPPPAADPGTDAGPAGDATPTIDTAPAVDVMPAVDAVSRVDTTPTVDTPPAVDIPPAVDTAPPADAGTTPDDAPTGEPLRFVPIYETILRPRCGRCHGDAEWGPLRMPDAPTAYRNLLNVAVQSQWIESCASSLGRPFSSLRRARPFEPEASMVYFLPRCYVRDAEHNTMTDSERDTVRAWIMAGALY